MSKLVNPVHLFDEHGTSVQSSEFLRKQVERLEAENSRLRILLRKQQYRYQQLKKSNERPVIH